MFRTLTVADKVLSLTLLGVTIAVFWGISSLTTPGSSAIVMIGDQLAYKLPLDANKVVTAQGRIGDVTIEVRGGKVGVTRADCPNHVCVRTGWRSRGGEVIVCVPNHVWVKILSNDKPKIKGVTG
jgi:hypothetical protein